MKHSTMQMKRQSTDRKRAFIITYLTKDSYLEYMKNSHVSTVKKILLENGQRHKEDVSSERKYGGK